MERMASDQWSTTTTVVKKLFDTPYAFSFLQAVRIFKKVFPNRENLGKTVNPKDDPILFESNYAYSLPSSDIKRIDFSNDRPEIEVNFWNLAGPHGALPTPLSERVIERVRNGDSSLKDFVNIFNHRLLSIYCRVAEKYSFVLSPEKQNKTTSHLMLASIAGFEFGVVQYKSLFASSLIKYAGLLWQRPRSAVGLEQLLQDYFQVPIFVEQLIGGWVEIDRRQRTFIGRKKGRNHILGKRTFLGKRFWQAAHHFVVNVGPLSSEAFHQFIPTGDAYISMCDLVRLYAPIELSFQIKVHLGEGEKLGSLEMEESSVNNRLGWTAVLNQASNSYNVSLGAS